MSYQWLNRLIGVVVVAAFTVGCGGAGSSVAPDEVPTQETYEAEISEMEEMAGQFSGTAPKEGSSEAAPEGEAEKGGEGEAKGGESKEGEG